MSCYEKPNIAQIDRKGLKRLANDFAEGIKPKSNISNLTYLNDRFEAGDDHEQTTNGILNHGEMSKRELWAKAGEIHQDLFERAQQSQLKASVVEKEKLAEKSEEVLHVRLDHLVTRHTLDKEDDLYEKRSAKRFNQSGRTIYKNTNIQSRKFLSIRCENYSR